MTSPAHLTILGGGPAGLALGYYAKKARLPFMIYEAGNRTGGNAITFEHDGFRFDSGAHRFHAQDAEITADVESLLGDDFRQISVPSHIYDQGRYVDFPLSPLNLIAKLGPLAFLRAGLSLLSGRLRLPNESSSFEQTATHRYGRLIAARFLFNYSEKLWGRPVAQLAAEIAGHRLRGLNLATFVRETFQNHRDKTEHLDGTFYYPVRGYGAIVEALAGFCGADNIRTGTRVSRIHHDGRVVLAVELNGAERVRVSEVVSTLPLSLLARILDPPPEPEVMQAARRLQFRSLVLVAIFLDAPRITTSGTVYFPSHDIPFTRVYEPRNRSAQMSPPDKSSLCVEIPCDPNRGAWRRADRDLVAEVCRHLAQIGWVRPHQVLGSKVVRLPNAYPVMDLEFRARTDRIGQHCAALRNLKILGRNGRFEHSSVHQMLRLAKDAVNEYASRRGAS